MLIFSNNCLAGFCYRENNEQFNQPFIWTSIQFKDFINLLNNFYNINFKNIKISTCINNSKISYQNLICPIINIDNLINVYYFHYFEDDNKIEDNIEVDKRYVKTKNVIDFVQKLYDKRTDRMLLYMKDEKPIFVWDDTPYSWYDKNLDITLLNNLNNILIIYTDNPNKFGYSNFGKYNNINIIKKIKNGSLIEENSLYFYNIIKIQI